MSPGRPGGRPRNAWEFCGGTRNRLLVRLWTLTNLTKNEIRKVLKADDFDPSESDIQKKLRVLLPKDYAKDYKSFRPSDSANMRRRFLHLHRCKDGRVSKSRRYKISKPCPASWPNDDRNLPLVAFRNYSGALGTVSTELLSSISSPESEPTISSRLMIDGSIIRSEGSRALNNLDPEGTGNSFTLSLADLTTKSVMMRPADQQSGEGIQSISTIKTERATDPRTSDVMKLQNNYLRVGQSCVKTREETREKAMSEHSQPSTKSKRRSNRSILTIESLKRRLPNRSSTSIRHLYSVLGMSSSSSDRSSTSWRSSWSSMTNLGFSSRSEKGSRPPRATRVLSRVEEDTWKEIIDESKLLPNIDPRPAYSYIVAARKSCCEVNILPCVTCGFQVPHAAASDGAYDLSMLPWDVRDRFNNTPLHYAAASDRISVASMVHIVTSIESSKELRARNTSGENFIHVLTISPLDIFSGDLELLLTRLKRRHFSFLDRDFHGRTVMHKILKALPVVLTGSYFETVESLVKKLSVILWILQPDLNALDNQNYNAGDQLLSWYADLHWKPAEVQYKMEVLVKQYRYPQTKNISFRRDIFSGSWKVEEWLKHLELVNLVSWVDIHGDTPLTSLLKWWEDEDQELQLREIVHELIQMGAEINMRDRNGNTALAIAAMRGSRACVAELLRSGATPHSRNYYGNGIIKTATIRMDRAARQGKHKSFARIQSCIALLSDHRALSEPTEYDEWAAPMC